jgi:hypothetical protein
VQLNAGGTRISIIIFRECDKNNREKSTEEIGLYASRKETMRKTSV